MSSDNRSVFASVFALVIRSRHPLGSNNQWLISTVSVEFPTDSRIQTTEGSCVRQERDSVYRAWGSFTCSKLHTLSVLPVAEVKGWGHSVTLPGSVICRLQISAGRSRAVIRPLCYSRQSTLNLPLNLAITPMLILIPSIIKTLTTAYTQSPMVTMSALSWQLTKSHGEIRCQFQWNFGECKNL